jgi:hypothetical protein
MNKFEITDYKMLPFHMEIEYVYGEYYYTVLCDFQWSDECTSHYIDFTIIPLSGTFFHELNDHEGEIEITQEYTDFLQKKVKEFRDNTLWLSNEILEKQQDLETPEPVNWDYYGF